MYLPVAANWRLITDTDYWILITDYCLTQCPLPYAALCSMPLAFKPIDRFGPVRNLELVVDFVDVLFDGAIGDAEELADFFVQ